MYRAAAAPPPIAANMPSRERAQRQLAEYVRGLYTMLNNVGACFLSGAFVIDDRNHHLKLLLQAGKGRTLIGPLMSHTSLQPYTQGVCGGVCEVHLTDVPLSCGGAERRVYRNIKWYTFNNRADGAAEPERFVYFKLETQPTLSLAHARSAIDRYVLKKETHKSSLQRRREDCVKDKAGCTCYGGGPLCATRHPRDPHGFATGGQDGVCVANEATHRRSGDEFFVPTSISDAILASREVVRCR